MAPTHVAMSLAFAAAVAVVAPAAAPLVVVAALVGGVFPDLDMVVGVHRKTLHQPELFAAGTLLFGALAVATRDPTAIAAATGSAAAALHCAADYAGGSSEPNPWEATTDRGIYVRTAGGWVAPRRLAAYDGSPGDLALAAALSIPGFVTLDSGARAVLLVSLVVGVGYTAVRKRVPQLSGRTPALYPMVVALFSMLLRRR
ncbi:hypothetical protein C440_04218 [Haloferax mucosum ATCC BAA-1512]|uniref:Membrane-bound metal-dependent hydrolase n=1 Tax=Haloferax mucosum ATCC BAA-1512 TaxID=662479 RepID=M0IJG9_9EURY|nr:hypothetical protein [Haloferax mucosum]ELZ96951.1 hypothetical protein C440_04218 [Haloferax mucosum ATCC BAA-1512]